MENQEYGRQISFAVQFECKKIISHPSANQDKIHWWTYLAPPLKKNISWFLSVVNAIIKLSIYFVLRVQGGQTGVLTVPPMRRKKHVIYQPEAFEYDLRKDIFRKHQNSPVTANIFLFTDLHRSNRWK